MIFKNLIICANALDGMVAYDRDTFREVWRLPVTNGVEPSADIVNDRLFFGASDGQFYSVNAKTGDVIWTFPIRIEGLSEPLLVDGVVYFLSGSNTLYALDAATGKQIWIYSRQDTSSLSIRGGSKPVYKNGTLFVGFSDGAMVALLAKDGSVKWERVLNKNKRFKDLDTDPVIEGDDLYFAGFDDAMYCLRVATGEVVWRAEHGGYGRPLISGDTIFFASSTNEVVALERHGGKRIWGYPQEGIATSPQQYKELLVFGESQGALVFLNLETGKKVGEFVPGRGVFTSPLIDAARSRIYFMSNESNLYGLIAGWGYPPATPYLEPGYFQ